MYLYLLYMYIPTFVELVCFFLLTKINKVGCCNNPYHFKFTDNHSSKVSPEFVIKLLPIYIGSLV